MYDYSNPYVYEAYKDHLSRSLALNVSAFFWRGCYLNCRVEKF